MRSDLEPPHLGDSHNFGRRVTLGAGTVRKPRATLWEWLTLSARSPLRRCLDGAAVRDGLGRDAFSFLPDLAFRPSRTGVGGAVEHVKLAPLTARSLASQRTLARVVGRSLALWSWLGVSDLHWENLVLGVDARGRLVLAPLDVEMILDDLSLPTETKLIADADPDYAAVCRHAAGVRRVLPFLGKPTTPDLLVTIAAAYVEILAFLERNSRAIADVISALPGLRETPIRVCLRGTDEYVRARTEPIWPPLLAPESEQLSRGDIPYFFRLYGRPGIHYYANRALTRLATLPRRGDVPKLEPLLSLARGLRSPRRSRLREEGLFTVLGAFDDPSFTGTHAADHVTVTFRPRTLSAKLATGEALKAHRDLSAFVGSAYLPCRCGEVRSVFVPRVTACKAQPASPFSA